MGKRNAHLKKLADAKRKKTSASVEDADAVDWCDSERQDSDSHDGCHEHPVEAAGEAARRNRRASYEGRRRERLRGIGAQAGAMAAFVLASATGIARGVVDQLVDAAFAVVAERAAAAAAAATAAAAAAASAEMAATNALRRAKRKEQQPATERALLPRGRRTFAEAEPCALAQRPVQRPAQEAAPGKGAKNLAPRRRFSPATVKALRRIACDRRLQRADVVGGEKMSRAEWAQLRGDAWELRKVYAVDAYLRLRAVECVRCPIGWGYKGGQTLFL